MYRSMNLKGFVLILAIMLVIFLVFHLTMKSDVDEKSEKAQLLRIQKTKLEEEYKNLNSELSIIGTEDYIMTSAVKEYAYVQKDAIRFEYTNPEALYAYTEEALQILMDEMNN